MKLTWSVELAEFSANSPAAVIRVEGASEDGRKYSKVIIVNASEIDDDITHLTAKLEQEK